MTADIIAYADPPRDLDPIARKRAVELERDRVVDLIRGEVPGVAVFYCDRVISIRATTTGASRDVVLLPGDRFTVTPTTVIRRGSGVA